MIGNYLNEPNKYLYGVLNPVDEEVYAFRLHHTIKEATIFVRDKLITYYPEKDIKDIKVKIYRKENRIVPSKYSGINTAKIFKLLKDSNKYLSDQTNFVLNNDDIASMYSKLPYEKIMELVNIINNFLDKNIDNTDWYEVGEFVEEITLPYNEYIKYL
ncbi:hypothetical protein CPT77_03925 [Snodgrassella alvi]|uniref:hypothetical protein n=1 Tax=Snodgrassella alvi TaxID=1196083 RepID=UPI000BBD5769|nr:hypothetical protein [Snodgrassella alvi]PCL21058.1 hypothetical protein CPT77_03925 [Snodgrassella alvi]